MPIYEQTYRTYEGVVGKWMRWRPMVVQELRVLSRSWAFRILFGIGMLQVLVRALFVYCYAVIASDPENPISLTAKQLSVITVDERMFFDFIRLQSPILFVMTILAGAGMICNDFRYNLMEVYFSKPLNWRDYVIGKVVALSIVGFSLTAFPALGLLLQYNVLLPSMETFTTTYWYAGAIVMFSLALVLPTALGVLASSALIESQRFAGIAVFMLLFGNLTIGTTLPALLHERNYLILAFPAAINHVGQHLFKDKRLLFDLHWEWCVYYIALVCLVALWIICRRVRRAEIA